MSSVTSFGGPDLFEPEVVIPRPGTPLPDRQQQLKPTEPVVTVDEKHDTTNGDAPAKNPRPESAEAAWSLVNREMIGAMLLKAAGMKPRHHFVVVYVAKSGEAVHARPLTVAQFQTEYANFKDRMPAADWKGCGDDAKQMVIIHTQAGGLLWPLSLPADVGAPVDTDWALLCAGCETFEEAARCEFASNAAKIQHLIRQQQLRAMGDIVDEKMATKKPDTETPPTKSAAMLKMKRKKGKSATVAPSVPSRTPSPTRPHYKRHSGKPEKLPPTIPSRSPSPTHQDLITTAVAEEAELGAQLAQATLADT